MNSILVETNAHNELSIVSSPQEFSTPSKEFSQNVILNLSSSPLKLAGKKKAFNFDICTTKNSQQQQINSVPPVVVDGQVNSQDFCAKGLKLDRDSEQIIATNLHLSMNMFEKKLSNMVNSTEKLVVSGRIFRKKI